MARKSRAAHNEAAAHATITRQTDGSYINPNGK
jgi:hypothetical protein